MIVIKTSPLFEWNPVPWVLTHLKMGHDDSDKQVDWNHRGSYLFRGVNP